jgi:hypothetical protein
MQNTVSIPPSTGCQSRTHAKLVRRDKSRQVIDSKNVLEEEGHGALGQCHRFRLGFRQLKIDFDTNRIVCCFVTSHRLEDVRVRMRIEPWVGNNSADIRQAVRKPNRPRYTHYRGPVMPSVLFYVVDTTVCAPHPD